MGEREAKEGKRERVRQKGGGKESEMPKSAARHAEAELMTETVDLNVQLNYILVSRGTRAQMCVHGSCQCGRKKIVPKQNAEKKKKVFAFRLSQCSYTSSKESKVRYLG